MYAIKGENNMDDIILTDNGKVVLRYMQANDHVVVGKDLTDLTGVKGIYPTLTSLIKKGLVQPCEPVSRNFTNIKGITQLKEYKTYSLTDAGRAFQL
jgi:hypothetical protein